MWYGPAVDDDTVYDVYDDDIEDIQVTITTLTLANIYTEDDEEHNHEIAKGIIDTKATYSNAVNESMFRRKFTNIYLRRDLYVTRDVARTWKDYEELNICLNGKTMHIDPNVNFLDITNSVRLVITDCKGNGHIDVKGDNNTVAPFTISSGSVLLHNLTFDNTNGTIFSGNDRTKLEIIKFLLLLVTTVKKLL